MLAEALRSLPAHCGEILIQGEGQGWMLSRQNDEQEKQIFGSEAAADLTKYDVTGNYRKLKTAPNLRGGWIIVTKDLLETERALDAFYPGRQGVWRAWRDGTLQPTSLRNTLNRQTGMYRAAARISDDQIETVVRQTCNSETGCLRKILWRRDEFGALPCRTFLPEKYEAGLARNEIPLLCQEACPILVGACRNAVNLR